jgi:hypothetical protein
MQRAFAHYSEREWRRQSAHINRGCGQIHIAIRRRPYVLTGSRPNGRIVTVPLQWEPRVYGGSSASALWLQIGRLLLILLRLNVRRGTAMATQRCGQVTKDDFDDWDSEKPNGEMHSGRGTVLRFDSFGDRQ